MLGFGLCKVGNQNYVNDYNADPDLNIRSSIVLQFE